MWPSSLPFRERIQKGAVRYLLQRYLGQFLEEKLTLNQLTIDLYNGTGSVSDVSLYVQAINDLCDQHNLPFEFVDGYISSVSVSIPWSSLLTDASYVEVSGLEITMQPKQTEDSDTSMLESMWSSMSSSMQMATECFQQSQPEDPGCNAPAIEGVEKFAQIIDSILKRVKVKFVDTLIRLEHLPKGSDTGVALEIRIKHMDYCNEAESERRGAQTADFNPSSGFSISQLHLEGVSFYTDEFPAEERTFSSYFKPHNAPDEDDELEPGPSLVNENKGILIAKLGGRQQVKLQVKQEDPQGPKIQGPKVDLELILGSLSVFLSPRQLHLLLELGHGMAAPDTQDNSNVARCVQKPMGLKDFKRVEQQLLSELQPAAKGLHTAKGWSSAPLDDSDEEFYPFQGAGPNLSDSMLSEATSLNASFSSSCSSFSKSSTSVASFNPAHASQHGKKKKKGQKTKGDGDMGTEESRLHMKFSSLSIVLLHEDILTISTETRRLTKSSIMEMSWIADRFFQELGLYEASGYGKKDFEAAKKIFLKACQHNHIRLLAAPVIMESDEKRSQSSTVIGAVITAASVELLECLVGEQSSNLETEYVELLKFEETDPMREGVNRLMSHQPDMRVTIKHTTRIRSNVNACPRPPHTDVSILLQNCSMEVDLSIVDRISAVLNPQPLCSPRFTTAQPGYLDLNGICQPVDFTAQTKRKTDLKISSPLAVIKIRFPIPDLKPVYWRRPWKRSVRKDIMFAHLSDATFTTCLHTSAPSSDYEIKGKEVTLFFQEGDTDVQVPIGFVQAGEQSTSSETALLRLKVSVYPCTELAGLEENFDSKFPTDANMMQSFYIEPSQTEPSPFSSKHVLYESERSSQNEGEELVIPGDREEMGRFIDVASRNTNLQVEINLPKVNLHFPSKHIYELLYNRFNTDLSLWMSSPQLSARNSTIFPPSAQYFSMCKNSVQSESESESSDSETIYYSTQDTKSSLPQTSGQSKVTVSLNIGQGALSLITDVKNDDSNCENHGHLQLRVREASVFTVSAFKGTPQLNYVCVRVNKFMLDHCSELTGVLCPVDLRRFSSHSDTHLDPVIYRTEAGAKVHRGSVAVGAGSHCSEDMLTVAVQSQMDESHMKVMKLACGIRGATFRHRMTYSKHSWLLQLKNFFDVMEHPVAGYQPSQVITELHKHLWDCALDYRPLHLPMRCLLAVESFSISSNVAKKTSCSTLRFIAEDAFLFISNKTSPTVELRLDYICVVDLGLFELTLRMMSDNPQVDLRVFNNKVNIRTCSDSARLLAQLLGYVASYGDLEPEPTAPVPIPEDINTLSDSAILRVNQLMEEAMIDEQLHRKRTKSGGSAQTAPEGEFYFFPDETVHIEVRSSSPPSPDVSDSDDFVMVEYEPGIGVIPQNYPIVRKLTDEPQVIIENHFVKPTHRRHDLEPPAHFPIPVYKYELCEMTLQWKMYGGSDFETVEPSHKKHVSINTESGSVPSSPAYKKHFVDVNYSRTCPQEVTFHRRLSLDNQQHPDNQTHTERGWWQMGGLGRDHDTLMELHLSKVQFHYHVYPKDTEQASRQALAIKEVEICDKLKVSNINKFLYQYSSNCHPKTHCSNMVEVRALHIRPDLKLPDQECSLRIQLKPLRFNIDQDSLIFLIKFISEITDFSVNKDIAAVPVSPRHLPPVMGVDVDEGKDPAPSPSPPSPQLLIDLSEPKTTEEKTDTLNSANNQTPSSPIYFRRLDINIVFIKFDYVGKHVDMTQGPLAGLLMGLTQLNNSDLCLRDIHNNIGLLGVDKLVAYIQKEWYEDIRMKLPKSCLMGIGPMTSFAQLCKGLAYLIVLPIDQYQRDGRVFRGLQRGLHAFSINTCLAGLELTSRLVQLSQSVAETMFDMVSTGPSVRRRKHKRGNKIRSRNTPPADFREGVSNAVTLVKEGIEETAQTLVHEAITEHEDKGVFGAVGGVLRQIPPTIVTPFILASAATSNLLGGAISQLEPDTRREAELKWRDKEST